MKAAQVDKALARKFVDEGVRLVFWHDDEGDFAGYIAEGLSGDLHDVQIIDLGQSGTLAVKIQLERDDIEGCYLVYSTGEPVPLGEDFLADIRLYSAAFHADMASLWQHELGLSSLQVRDHLKARAVFLGRKERRTKLKQHLAPQDGPAAIDLKMMAVLAESTVATGPAVLRALCDRHMNGGLFDLGSTPNTLQTFDKMGLSPAFWALMAQEFAYDPKTPSVGELLRRLFISALLHQTGDANIRALAHHKLPPNGTHNASVFLTQWQDSSAMAQSYDAAAAAVAAEQGIGGHLASLDLDAIRGVTIFWEAEKLIVSRLKERLLHESEVLNTALMMDLSAERKAGHWLAGPGSEDPEREAVSAAYDAIVAAAQLFALHQEYRGEFHHDTPEGLLGAYRRELYQFDRLYRRFFTQSRLALVQGWNLLKTLATQVEQVYQQGYLQPMGMEWSRLLDDGFLARWTLKGIPAQQDFYDTQIRRHLGTAERRRAFVIISDAFRYEAAKELTKNLNGRFRMNAELSTMLGVLPSYTALGMASLLPHQSLAYNEKGNVLVDGKSTDGIEARNRVLAQVQGMACHAKTLREMNTEEARAFTNGKRVIYIYHNVIDARGDTASTEGETFDAVATCIEEVAALVKFCVNKLNAAKVWVTADHGFLFREEAPHTTDKSALSHRPERAVKAKKRYVIGPELGPMAEAHHGSTARTVGAEGGMEFWVPRGANLFHLKGGARFVHGGAMPQEVVIPLIAITQLRGDKVIGSRPEKVAIQIKGTQHRVTGPVHRFFFIQTEAVSERRKPITLRIGIYENGEPVSDIGTLTFDSESERMDTRQKDIRLRLGKGPFDKKTIYRLILRDAESDAEELAVPVVIDRSFQDDF